MKSIRLLIVDDDEVWAESLANFLKRDHSFIISGIVHTQEALQSFLVQTEVDIILLDINLTENRLDGIDVAQDLQLNYPNIKIIMLTSLNQKDIILNSFSAGAIHYLTKADFRKLPDIIPSVIIETSTVNLLLDDYRRLRQEDQLKLLTKAEREIYDYISQGYSHTEIKQELFKSDSTLRNQVSKLLKKLGLSNTQKIVKQKKKITSAPPGD